MEAMTFIATAPHVKVETLGGAKYTRLQAVGCPSCQTPFYLWASTLKLSASEVRAKVHNIPPGHAYNKNMPMEVRLDAVTRERLEEQSGLLLRIYEEEFAKDPASQATRNSRSNMIALRHSINQVYGEAVGIL